MRLDTTTARAAACCALLLAPGCDPCVLGPCDTGGGETGETGETADSGGSLNPCDFVPCDDSGNDHVQLEAPFVGPYVWFCDAVQGSASYTVALDVEITAEDAAAAILQTDFDAAYVAATGEAPTIFTTGVPQDAEGRPVLACTWDPDLEVYCEERLTLRGA